MIADELVIYLNRVQNKFKLVMSILTGQMFKRETTQSIWNLENDDADRSDNSDILLNNPKMKNALLTD